jgi:hypothetical protein
MIISLRQAFGRKRLSPLTIPNPLLFLYLGQVRFNY